MDEDTGPRRHRAAAGASLFGATALLVLTFGPSALALSPSAPSPAAQPARVAVASPVPPPVSGTAHRASEEAQRTGDEA